MQHENCWTNEIVISSLTSQMILIAYNTLEIVLRISLGVYYISISYKNINSNSNSI